MSEQHNNGPSKGECHRCGSYGRIVSRWDDEEFCKSCDEVAYLKNQQRKRQPTENPGDGEVVLVKLKDFDFRLCRREKFPTRPWIEHMTGFRYLEKDIEWWVPIKHLLESDK